MVGNSLNRILRACIAFLILMMGSNAVNAQFVHTPKTGKTPWTSEPVINGNNFRFVIIGDLTGGEEPGVFEAAVERINELAPDFVMSVGDLIDGYTLDTGSIESQWEQFNSSVSRLDAPFFYVPGNHDVANRVLIDVWKAKYGFHYYTFKAGKVLFVVLNTWEPGVQGISEEQLQNIKKDITGHPDSEPLFVFTHDPFWESADKPGLCELNTLFETKSVTFFCGHEHRYLHLTVKGKHHYMLASVASGEPGLEEVNLGKFRNLMMVTVTPQKTSIANLALDGLISPSVVDNETKKQVEVLLGRRWAKIIPTVIKAETGSEFHSQLRLENKGDFPLEIKGKFAPIEDYTFSPSIIQTTVPAGETFRLPVVMQTKTPETTHQLHPVKLNLTARFLQQNKNLSSDVSVNWIIDGWEKCERPTESSKFLKMREPGGLEEGWDWHGSTDGIVSYRVNYDEKFIYINLKTEDDSLVVNKDISVVQDKINLFMAADTTYGNTGYFEFEFFPGHDVNIKNTNNISLKGVEGSCISEGNSLLVSLKFPRKYLNGNFFRMNFSFTDTDDRTNLEPSVLWWKPRWWRASDYPQSGIFFISDK